MSGREGGGLWSWGRRVVVKNVKVGGEAQGSVEEEGRWSSFSAAAVVAAGRLHDGDT